MKEIMFALLITTFYPTADDEELSHADIGVIENNLTAEECIAQLQSADIQSMLDDHTVISCSYDEGF